MPVLYGFKLRTLEGKEKWDLLAVSPVCTLRSDFISFAFYALTSYVRNCAYLSK